MHNHKEVEHIGFFLLDNFSMLSFAAALEPLRMANRLNGKTLYEWDFYTLNDTSVTASNDIEFNATRTMSDTAHLDTLFVVAGIGAHQVQSPEFFKWLRNLQRRGVVLGATSTGSLVLAKAGLLNKHTCTVHWESKTSFEEQYPFINVSDELYEFDRNMITCSGGLAGLDMMLHHIAQKHGAELSHGIAEQSIHPTIRPAHDNQRMALQLRHKIRHPRLLKALELMQANIEEVLTCGEISELVGLSSRQLERLFKELLNTTPANHYLQLRLQKANHLLHQTSLSIMQISTACGFSSTSHFARCYRKQYGYTPSQECKNWAHSNI